MKTYRYVLVLGILFSAVSAYASSGAGDHSAEPSMTHRMMRLALQLGAILFAAKLGGILFEKLKMPSVLGELAAGALIGPFALGALPLPEVAPLAEVRAWLMAVPVSAGARGILLGIALATGVTGIRVFIGQDRSFRERSG